MSIRDQLRKNTIKGNDSIYGLKESSTSNIQERSLNKKNLYKINIKLQPTSSRNESFSINEDFTNRGESCLDSLPEFQLKDLKNEFAQEKE